MSLPAVLTLVAIGLIVAALAVYLVAVLVVLRKTLQTLGTINVGLRAIAHRTEPLEPVLTEINEELASVRDALKETLDKAASIDREVAS